jgi:hypothetical protein
MIAFDPATGVRVRLPNPYHGHATTFRHRSNEWAGIHPRYLVGDEIRVPDAWVGRSARVDDEARYVIAADGTLRLEPSVIQAGGVALVLESPHKDEFDANQVAVGPLSNPSSQRLLERHLPGLLERAADASGQDFSGRQLVLVNAVQYQCSLQSLMRPEVKALQRCVRDAVWLTLFASGGAEDLIGRLGFYRPAAVLLAPTRMVRQTLARRIGEAPRPWPWVLASSHPTAWRSNQSRPRPLPLHPDEALAAMPAKGDVFRPFHWIDGQRPPYVCNPVELVG